MSNVETVAGAPRRLPFGLKVVYALGQLGWSLASFGAINYLNQYYLPFNEKGAVLYPKMIYQGYVIGVLTVIGLALAFGRVFDAITDPLVAVMSDRSRLKLGRRRGFLALSVFPFALFSFLVFVPIGGAGGAANVVLNCVWLFVTITMLYWFMTMYVTPFFAWMSELGHDADERLQLSTMISITWALGAAIGTQAPLLQTILQSHGFTALAAFQLVMACCSGLALIFMILPVIFIDERKYCVAAPCDDGFFRSIGNVMKDRNFLIFTISDFAYWIAMYFVQTGLMYYLTVLLGLSKEAYSFYFLLIFIVSFAFYVPIGILARKVGRKRLLVVGFALLAALFVYASTFGKLPIPAPAQALIAALLAALPIAIFGILPNAMVSDMAEAYAIETGMHKGGVFFGFRTFMSKMGQSVGAILFPSVIMIGANAIAPSDGAAGGKELVGNLGVRLTTFLALGFCAMGIVFLCLYDEKKVMASLKKREKAQVPRQ